MNPIRQGVNKRVETDHEQICFDLSQPSDNAQVVLFTRKLLEKMGFDEPGQYLITSAVSELSTNILRYAKTGTLSLRVLDKMGRQGVEVIAEDQGPGIRNLDQALTEHFSSGNGLGLGLPSVKRIMDEFDIRTAPGTGTRITAIKWMD